MSTHDPLTSDAGPCLASLAAPVRVHGLLEHAPHIANQLATSCNDATSTALLLEQLLLDEGMQSLPPVIASDLLRLYEHHVRCRTLDAPNTTWELPASGLQALQSIAASRRSPT